MIFSEDRILTLDTPSDKIEYLILSFGSPQLFSSFSSRTGLGKTSSSSVSWNSSLSSIHAVILSSPGSVRRRVLSFSLKFPLVVCHLMAVPSGNVSFVLTLRSRVSPTSGIPSIMIWKVFPASSRSVGVALAGGLSGVSLMITKAEATTMLTTRITAIQITVILSFLSSIFLISMSMSCAVNIIQNKDFVKEILV